MAADDDVGAGVLSTRADAETVAPGVHLLPAQGNALAVETEAGVVLVDSGPGGSGTEQMIAALRDRTDDPVHAICYSHGHMGYNGGITQWVSHNAERGDTAPRLIAHERLVDRYARYRETLGLQRTLAEVQFPGTGRIPARFYDFVDPTETIGDDPFVVTDAPRIEVFAAPSETDDAIALWLPESRILYGGAATPGFTIPNIGTPLRSQRLTIRWADTLDRMAALRPTLLLHEFGENLEGEDAIQDRLTHTAETLRWFRAEVVERLNQGLSEAETLAAMEYPDEMFDPPWMGEWYGCRDFIVRDIYREENGWWDRNPTTLFPADPEAAAAARRSAVADPQAVIDRGRELIEEGEAQLALHALDVLAFGPDDDPDVRVARELKAEASRLLAERTHVYVAKALYVSSANRLEDGRTDWQNLTVD